MKDVLYLLIKPGHHTTSLSAVVENKLIRLQDRLQHQVCQISSLKQQVRQLLSDKKVLTAEVAEHKWNRILAKKENTTLRRQLADAQKETEALKEELRLARLPQNSSNSSRAPSTDLFKSRRNRSLRAKSGRKPGGQPGHLGS